MSAPSDGARADARKRLAAEVVAPDEQIMRALVARFHDPDVGTWSGHSTVPATCFMCTEAATELAGVIADAKAEERERISLAVEAACRLVSPDHLTPMGKRMILAATRAIS